MKRNLLVLVIVLLSATQTFCQQNTELNFTAADGTATICLRKQGSPSTVNLEYRLSNESVWNSYTVENAITIPMGQTAYLRSATNANHFSRNTNNYYYFTISSTGSSVEADGNIMSLIDPTMQMDSVPQYAFCYLFQSNPFLKQCPQLPAQSLGRGCYEAMFYGCVSLSEAPELPAMSLATECYKEMFIRCSFLTKAPELPATTMANSCYEKMFYSCNSIEKIPQLQATNLAEACYEKMFYLCSALVVNSEAPGKEWQIPADAENTENFGTEMFYGTRGTLTGCPEIGKTYYVESDTTKEEPVGVEIAEETRYIVCSDNGQIIVKGATGMKVSVYDVNGRMVAEAREADETQYIAVDAVGVCFVNIGGRRSVKVIVE